MTTATLRRLPMLLVWLGLLAFPSPASAHRLDEYLQATLVAIEPDSIRLQINLTPGVAVAEQVLAQIDHDGDGAISTDESAAYSELLRRDLLVRLDDRDTALKLTASSFPAPAELRAGLEIIQMEFSATPGSLAPGAHRFTLENRHLSAVSVYLFNAAQPRSGALQIITQKRNENQSTAEIEFTFHPPPANSSSRVAGIVASLAALLFVAVFVGLWRAAGKRSLRLVEARLDRSQ